MTEKRVVIFDFDGTLANSVEWFFLVLNEIAREHHFHETTWEEREFLRRRPPLEILNALGVPKWKLPIIARHMRRLAAENLSQIELYGWVGKLLTQLKAQGFDLAVVSSNSEQNIRTILAQFAELIDLYETGASLFGKSGKFKRVLKTLKASPAEAVSVGDEVRDVEASQRAGIDCIAVGWGLSHPEALIAAKAAALAETPHELTSLLLARSTLGSNSRLQADFASSQTRVLT